MNIIELEPPEAPPDVPPPGSAYWDFYGDFDEDDPRVREIEPHPTDDLVGRVTLEDEVENAEAKHVHGRVLSSAEIALLALAREYMDYDDEDQAI